MIQLTSAHNPRLQEIRKAVRSGRPLESGLIVIEGPHSVEEALASAWTVAEIFATENARARFDSIFARAEAAPTLVSERAFESISATGHSQGLIALVRPRPWAWNDLFRAVPLIVVLEAIQDPGNAGTIIRSAEAFGATGIVFGHGCVRISNPKLLRAAAGSLFRMPFIENVGAPQLTTELRAHNVRLYALTAGGQQPLGAADLCAPCAIAVGNEGTGLSRELLGSATGLCIPIQQIESLNAGVACSIALFEAARQRGLV
jgi:TrmH family RNA methyltransferase